MAEGCMANPDDTIEGLAEQLEGLQVGTGRDSASNLSRKFAVSPDDSPLTSRPVAKSNASFEGLPTKFEGLQVGTGKESDKQSPKYTVSHNVSPLTSRPVAKLNYSFEELQVGTGKDSVSNQSPKFAVSPYVSSLTPRPVAKSNASFEGLSTKFEGLQVGTGKESVPNRSQQYAVSPNVSPLISRPVAEQVDVEGRPLIYFDLETTGLGRTSHITQIAAVKGHHSFSRFVLPRIPIEHEAQEITGITCSGDVMCHQGNRVTSVGVRRALEEFIEFIECNRFLSEGEGGREEGEEKEQERARERGIKREGGELEGEEEGGEGDQLREERRAGREMIGKKEEEGSSKPVIIGHNIKNFDCPILLNALQACGLVGRLQRAVHGFVDTLPLFRDFAEGLDKYNMSYLHNHYLGKAFDAHDAREDVKALQHIVEKAQVPSHTMSKHSFTLTHIIEVQGQNLERSRALRAWMPLVNRKVISEPMAKKAAGSGLLFEDVRRVFESEGKEGVRNVFQQQGNDGKARVTKVKRILDDVCGYLENN